MTVELSLKWSLFRTASPAVPCFPHKAGLQPVGPVVVHGIFTLSHRLVLGRLHTSLDNRYM
jgi:hypothetical protein